VREGVLRARAGGNREIALEHDLFVLTDEIYEYFLFDGQST